MFPLLPLYVVVGRVAVVTATLSVRTPVNVTVWVWAEVVKEILVSSALKLVIVGAKSSDFVILIV